MKTRNIVAILAILLSSSVAFASAPVPFNVRTGHGIIYIDWTASALPTDSVKLSTPDGLSLGTLSATPENKSTKQIILPSDKNISTVLASYNGTIHSIPLSHGMGSGRNR